MPLYFYDLPNWLLGTLITATWVLIGLGGYFLTRRCCRVEFDDAEKNIAIAMLAVIATVNSLLLAFSAVSVWESFGSASEAVHQEANTIGALGRDLAVYDSPAAFRARELLRTYTHIVVDQEWRVMQAGKVSQEARSTFDDAFRAVALLEPQTARQQSLVPEIWARMNEILRLRRDRLYTTEAQVPITLWIVVVIGTVMTIAATYVLPRTLFNLVAIGALSYSMGLVFFFLVAMDRPFAGQESISPRPFEVTLQDMAHWDMESAAEAYHPAGEP